MTGFMLFKVPTICDNVKMLKTDIQEKEFTNNIMILRTMYQQFIYMKAKENPNVKEIDN